MLIIEERGQEHFNKVVAEATRRGLTHRLLRQLAYLNGYNDDRNDGSGRMNVVLGYDGAAMSFSVTWVMTKTGQAWMHGGLIFHPDYVGNEPQQTGDWSVHT